MVTYPEIPTWYASLTKPWWTPPNCIFPLVWSVLYAMMGVSLWLLWDRSADTPRRRTVITLFFVQLVLNAAWSPVFFGLHHARAALVIIVLLAAAIAATILAAWHTQRMAAWLLVPYLAWVVYATTLNAGIVASNVS
jgi:tryptophan-rich sensory protein